MSGDFSFITGAPAAAAESVLVADAPPPLQSARSLFALLISVSALNSVAINLIVPSLTSIAHDLGSNYETIQFTTSAFLIANAVGFLCLGSVSDRLGRRPVLIGGLCLFAAASAVCAVAPTTGVLLAARVVEGIGASSGVVLGQAIIRDRYDHHRSASVIGYLALGFGAAPMLAPLVGGFIDDHLGWRTNFALLLVAGVVTTFAVYAGLTETRHRPTDTHPLASLRLLTGLPAFWAFTFIYTCSAGVFYSFLAGTSYAARFILNIDGTDYGLYFIVVNLGYSAGAFLTGRFVRRAGVAPMMIAGGFVVVASTVGMACLFALGSHTSLTYFGPMLAINFGNGLMQSNAIASIASVRPGLAGTATGLAGALQVLFSAAATAAVGFVFSATRSELGFALVAIVFAAGALATGFWARAVRMG